MKAEYRSFVSRRSTTEELIAFMSAWRKPNMLLRVALLAVCGICFAVTTEAAEVTVQIRFFRCSEREFSGEDLNADQANLPSEEAVIEWVNSDRAPAPTYSSEFKIEAGDRIERQTVIEDAQVKVAFGVVEENGGFVLKDLALEFKEYKGDDLVETIKIFSAKTWIQGATPRLVSFSASGSNRGEEDATDQSYSFFVVSILE